MGKSGVQLSSRGSEEALARLGSSLGNPAGLCSAQKATLWDLKRPKFKN